MENKECFIKFRVTEIEKKSIQENAEKQGLKVSDFGRKMLLNGSVFILENGAVLYSVLNLEFNMLIFENAVFVIC